MVSFSAGTNPGNEEWNRKNAKRKRRECAGVNEETVACISWCKNTQPTLCLSHSNINCLIECAKDSINFLQMDEKKTQKTSQKVVSVSCQAFHVECFKREVSAKCTNYIVDYMHV